MAQTAAHRPADCEIATLQGWPTYRVVSGALTCPVRDGQRRR
jgi:hypothetical protein